MKTKINIDGITGTPSAKFYWVRIGGPYALFKGIS
jgi:hypothetical protein